MAYTLFGTPLRTGSWGLPEFGLTEKIQNLFYPDSPLTYQHGSNLFGPLPVPPYQPPAVNQPQPQTQTYRASSPGITAPIPSAGIPQQIQNAFSPPSQQDLNAVYDPFYGSLAEQETTAKSDYENLLGSLSKNEALVQQELGLQKKTQETELGRQSVQTQQQLGSALSQARQLYNELAQSNLARFGTATSTGPFMMELLGRETQRQMGTAQTQAGNIEAEINDRKLQLNEFTNLEMNKVKQSYEDKRMEAFQAYNQRIVSINSNRSMLDSQKAQTKINLDESYKQQLRALEQWRIENVLGLDLWNQQQQATLNKTIAAMPTSLNPDVFYNRVFPIGQTPQKIVQGAASPQQIANYYLPRKYSPTYSKKEDELNQLNPFA